ncbi:MAG: ATP-binding cassette domain-containing protein [Saprospiraceae bacterium]
MIQLKKVIPHPIKESFKSNSDIWLNDNVTLAKGEKYLISAASGKGKSTFLHLLYGLRKDFDGDVLIENKAIQDYSIEDWTQLRQEEFSIVFQSLRLFPQLTGLENILVKNALTNTKSQKEIEIMATQLGIFDILNQKTETMSYGQRQRIAIIRALCQPFSFLLLDEPFSHLDDENIKIACELINTSIVENQAGLLLVSLGDDYYLNCEKRLML